MWVASTADGNVLQKAYFDTSSAWRALGRDLIIRLLRHKTGARAAARWRTERDLLSLWRSAGIDVPRNLGSAHPTLESPRVLALEFIPGRPLIDILSQPEEDVSRARRDRMLRQFGASWSARHAKAIETGDVRFVQEHATLNHVLVTPDRMVTIDLEQTYRRKRDVRPALAKEISGYLRSLWKRKFVTPEVFRADMEALVDGYAHLEILSYAVTRYLDHPGRFRRAVWRLDAWRDGRRGKGAARKYAALAVLRDVLRARAPELCPPSGREAAAGSAQASAVSRV